MSAARNCVSPLALAAVPLWPAAGADGALSAEALASALGWEVLNFDGTGGVAKVEGLELSFEVFETRGFEVAGAPWATFARACGYSRHSASLRIRGIEPIPTRLWRQLLQGQRPDTIPARPIGPGQVAKHVLKGLKARSMGMERAFSPQYLSPHSASWAVGPGWYESRRWR